MFNPLSPGNKTEVCPCCFESFKLRDTPFRCSSPTGKCPGEAVDEVLEKHWEVGTLIQPVIPSDGKYTRLRRCSQCQLESRKRICPTCHAELPHTMGELKNMIFAVIGGKDAGKSHYIASLVEHIRNHVGPELDMLLSYLNDDTIKRYKKDFKKPLFDDGLLIESTQSATALADVRMPMVFSLTFTKKSWRGQPVIDKVITLVFFDTAGEDMNSEDTMSAVNKYIYRSDGLILLLDPLQLPVVRDQLGGTHLPDTNPDSDVILERTTNLIRKGRNLSSTARIPTPLAVTFTKFDALEHTLDQAQLMASANHRGGFDKADHDAVSGEVESLLASWDQHHLLHKVRTDYQHHAFFGVSALGCNPGADKKVPRVVPRRVEDPFLWLLHHHGLLKAAR